ncbi:MAG: hypothetical protein RSC91_12625, partial [Clostridia bacterium]
MCGAGLETARAAAACGGNGHRPEVGQLGHALGVVVVQLRQPGLESVHRHGHDAAVNLRDRTLV